MADDRWRTIRRVIDEIASQDRDIEFFQLVRLVEASRCRPALLPPDVAVKQPVGTARRLADEAVRFRAAIAGHFEPASARPLEQFQRPGSSEPTVIDTNFMAPAGAQGVLPQHYTSLILQRLREEDSSLKDFLDLFHHQLISYFVRGWGKVSELHHLRTSFWVVAKPLRAIRAAVAIHLQSASEVLSIGIRTT